MLRIFLVVWAIVISTFSVFAQVAITGELHNIAEGSKVTVKYFNNEIEFVSVQAAETKTDKNGAFVLNFELDKPREATLTIAEQQTTLFLAPKSRLHLKADYSNFDESITYTGPSSADNNYLAAEIRANFDAKSMFKY